MPRVAMFPEVDALPGAEGETAIDDGNRQRIRCQHRAGVRGHVVRPLGVVAVGRVGVGCQPCEQGFQIDAYRRVGVFAQDERGARMLQENAAQALPDSARGNHALDLARDIERAAPAGVEAERVLFDHVLMTTMIARGFAALSVALCLSSPLRAEAEDASVLAELAKPGHVLMLRHAHAPGFGDPPGFKLGDCATQRNLDGAGREQARRLGERLRAAGVGRATVYSSQWCRCLETAGLLNLGDVKPLSALNSFFGRLEEREGRLTAVRELLAGLSTDGGPVVLVTHQVTVSAITGRGVGSGGGYLLRLDGSGAPAVVGALTGR